MGEWAIRVDRLGKQYRLGAGRVSRNVREVLTSAVSAPFRALWRVREDGAVRDETIWALKEVSFEVKRGEVLGIIGRNGAGKSTLLKILSRITEPSEGCVELWGRVGSLLEVGTGFHSELSGRENVYLNGVILGMKRAEIDRKFEEIVAFAGVERFLDVPVKHYSSGMYMRLAFSVAAHLETEIVLVDEVLAVGDAAFQRKCLGKMQDVAGQGRTVLFVSHNMDAIRQLCGRSLLIRSGRLYRDGETEDVVAEYLSDAVSSDVGDFDYAHHPARAAKYAAIITRVRLGSEGGGATTLFYPDDTMRIDLTLDPHAPIKEPRVAIAIEDSLGRRIMTLASYFQAAPLPDIQAKREVRCVIPRLNLGPGRYLLSVSVATKYTGLLDSVDSAAWFEVQWRNNYGNGEPYHAVYGPVLARAHWQALGETGGGGVTA